MKKISYIICLTAILCSCNNELPIENVQELQTPKSKEDSEILSFKNSEEFLSTIENFDLDNPILTRASSSFVSAENIYEQENNENADNEYIGFLIPDEKYRNFFNKDLEIIINDTLYKSQPPALHKWLVGSSEAYPSTDRLPFPPGPKPAPLSRQGLQDHA